MMDAGVNEADTKSKGLTQRLSFPSKSHLAIEDKNYAYNRFQYIKQKMREGLINDEDF